MAEHVLKMDMPCWSQALKADPVVRRVGWSRLIRGGRDLDKPIQPAGLCPSRSVICWPTMSFCLVGLALGMLALSLPGWSLGGSTPDRPRYRLEGQLSPLALSPEVAGSLTPGEASCQRRPG